MQTISIHLNKRIPVVVSVEPPTHNLDDGWTTRITTSQRYEVDGPFENHYDRHEITFYGSEDQMKAIANAFLPKW